MSRFTAAQMNTIFSFVTDKRDFLSPGKAIAITNKLIEDCDDDEQRLLQRLIGYKVKCKQDGDHKHDGQMVEYTFVFTNKNKEITEVCTDMCLMVGWNHSQVEDIE